ncbi:MAG TPA: hypothetical protein VH230_15150, partial [Stellaceae bacterium]|nr:hypothetical protein [Stellaceae bacterium]
RLQTMLRLLPILLLAACGQQGAYGPGGRVEIGADGWRRPTHYYPPPGPQEDPWGPTFARVLRDTACPSGGCAR